jgi:hypothetical protein
MQAADALADAHLQGSGGASNIRPMGLRVRYDRFGFQEREVWDHFALGSLGEKDRPEMIEVEVGDKKSMLWPGGLDELGEGGKADSVEAEGGAIVGSIMVCLLYLPTIMTLYVSHRSFMLSLRTLTALPSSAHLAKTGDHPFPCTIQYLRSSTPLPLPHLPRIFPISSAPPNTPLHRRRTAPTPRDLLCKHSYPPLSSHCSPPLSSRSRRTRTLQGNQVDQDGV